MQPKETLSPGFTPIDEAVALIKSDTRANPVVDMDYLVSRLRWVEVGHNFRIPKQRRLSPDEMYRTKRGRLMEYETTGEVNIYIATAFDKELVRQTILEKFRELAGHEYREQITKGRSTVADDAQGKDAVRPRGNTPNTKEGDTIGSGGEAVSNSAGLNV